MIDIKYASYRSLLSAFHTYQFALGMLIQPYRYVVYTSMYHHNLAIIMLYTGKYSAIAILQVFVNFVTCCSKFEFCHFFYLSQLQREEDKDVDADSDNEPLAQRSSKDPKCQTSGLNPFIMLTCIAWLILIHI